MRSVEIENRNQKIILKLDKKSFNKAFIISLIKKLELESATSQAGISADILTVAEEINLEWWEKYGDDFLKDVKK